MWDVSYDNIQGGEDEEEQEGKKGRQIEWRQGTQFWAAVPLGLEGRDWKPLYLPAYEINMTLHSQASCLTSSQPYSGSKESIKTTLGHVCWGCFGMRDVQLCLSELLAGVQGVMKSLVSARLAQMQPLAPLDQWGSPRLWSAPSPSAPKCRESICVPAWVAPLHTNSWPSQICDEQKCSMERQAETWGCWPWGLQKLQHNFWRIQFIGFYLILPSDWYLNLSGLQNIVFALGRTF